MRGTQPMTRFQWAWQLRTKYRDKPKISFTDFTSFVVMQDLGIHEVLTDDAHFLQINLGFQVRPHLTGLAVEDGTR